MDMKYGNLSKYLYYFSINYDDEEYNNINFYSTCRI